MMKVSILVLLGLMVSGLLRRRSAAVRHWVLASAMTCAALTPALQQVVPRWDLAITLPWSRAEPQGPAVSAPVASLTDGIGRATAPSPPTQALAVPSLQTIWLAGVIVSLGLLLVGFCRLTWVASRSRPLVNGEWAESLVSVSTRRVARRRVRLLQSDHPSLLVTWGLARPTVLLPRAAREWSGDRIRVVLRHELAHVERHDWAIQMVAELVRCVYWFNPLVWLACRRLRQESEHACDDAVLEMGVEAPEYAAHLLDLARAFSHIRSRRSLFPAPAMARRSHLERRVRAMLNARVDRRPLSRRTAVAIVVGVLAITVSIAGVMASSDVPKPPRMLAFSAMMPPPAPGAMGSATAAATPGAQKGEGPSRPALATRPSVRRSDASLTAGAQGALAAYSGTLIDATGRFMPGVRLALTDTATKRYEIESDASGRFAFSGLPAGEYQVEVRKPGFLSKQGRVVLAAGQRLERDLVAQIGSLAETVVVQASAPGTTGGGTIIPRRIVPADAPDVDPCSQSLVGGCLTQPRKVVDASPAYPRAHAENGVSGKVVVEGTVGTDGYVKNLTVIEGSDPEFGAAAVEAVRLWQFLPVRLNGVAQECRIDVTVQFQAGRDF
jgi:TonB family protein